MSGVDYAWRAIVDTLYNGETYAVSPLLGTLLRFEAEQYIRKPTARLRLLGFRTERYDEDLGENRPDPIQYPLPLEVRGADVALSAQAHDVTRRVTRLLRWLPLATAIRRIARAAPVTGESVSFEAALKRVALAFGDNKRGDCLRVASSRYWMFRKLGWPVSINIGVLSPTEEMHAWVELEGQPLLECPDFLGHYQTAVRFPAHRAQ